MHQKNITLHFWLVSLFALGITLGVSHASHQGLPYQYYGVITLGVAHLALVLWIARDQAFDHGSSSQVLILAALIAVVALYSQPLLEDDHFRYLWDGFITTTTGKPYSLAPAAFFANEKVPFAMQDVLSGINHPEVPTIYGPVLQVLFALSYLIAPATLWPLKLLLCIALLAIVLLLRAAGVEPRWLLVLVLHPLVVKETALSGHPDLFIGLALLAAVISWQHGSEAWAGVLVSLAVAMKLSVLAVLPFFCIDRKGQLSWRGSAAMGFTLCVVYAPVWLASSGGEGSALAALGGQWVFNPLLFRLASALLGDGSARLAVLLLFACIWIVVVLLWLKRLRQFETDGSKSMAEPMTQQRPVPPVIPVLMVILLLSPVVNPWYWLWMLPLAVLHFSWSIWTAATLSLLAYAHVAQALTDGVSFISFAVPLWVTWVQMEAIFVALIVDFLAERDRCGKQ